MYGEQNRFDEMVEAREKALALFGELNDRAGQARCQGFLAYAQMQLGDADRAIEHSDATIELARACGARELEAMGLRYRGQACHARADQTDAAQCWGESLAIYEALGDPTADEVRAEMTEAGLDGATPAT